MLQPQEVQSFVHVAVHEVCALSQLFTHGGLLHPATHESCVLVHCARQLSAVVRHDESHPGCGPESTFLYWSAPSMALHAAHAATRKNAKRIRTTP
jgi:hypothetical protein